MPDTLGPALLGTAFGLVSTSTVVVAARLYCRYFLIGSIKLYDYFMFAALLTTWGIAVINYYQAKFGTGVHMADQTKDPVQGLINLTGTLKSWYVYQLVYLVDLALVKFSILWFYRAISSQRFYRIAIYMVIGLVAAFTVSMVLVNAYECPRPSDAWSPEILRQSKGSCNDLRPVYFGQAGFNIGSDIIILLLPMPMLATLQMRKTKRFTMIAIFSCGSVAVLASIIRTYALHVWATSPDVPYCGANILIWSQIEINVAIISASIPSLKPLFVQCFPDLISSPSEYQYRYYDRSGGSQHTGKSGAVTTSDSINHPAQGEALALRGLSANPTRSASLHGRPGTSTTFPNYSRPPPAPCQQPPRTRRWHRNFDEADNERNLFSNSAEDVYRPTRPTHPRHPGYVPGIQPPEPALQITRHIEIETRSERESNPPEPVRAGFQTFRPAMAF